MSACNESHGLRFFHCEQSPGHLAHFGIAESGTDLAIPALEAGPGRSISRPNLLVCAEFVWPEAASDNSFNCLVGGELGARRVKTVGKIVQRM